MAECTQESFAFPVCKRRVVEANFRGGDITSNGGVLLLREADRRLGLCEAVARVLKDPRDPRRCLHGSEDLLRQRVYALALGYEDLNDHDALRHDLAVQTAVDRIEPLASSATLCRWENRADREVAWRIHEVMLERFIASFDAPPEELILDFDATDDAVHGKQEGRFFHGYYDHYCFLPLYVFCGDRLLVSYLRPSKIDAARHAWAILALLVKRLNAQTAALQCKAQDQYAASKEKVRWFTEFPYAAGSWDRERRVIAKIEHTEQGINPRYVVTNLEGDPQVLYDTLYCARGEMENRIKEQQLDLFADRTSCHRWWPNQFRLLLSSLAYTLLEAIRRLALAGTELEQAYVGTLRLRLLKIGAVILRNTRRIRFLLSSACPDKALFFLVASKLAPG